MKRRTNRAYFQTESVAREFSRTTGECGYVAAVFTRRDGKGYEVWWT